MLKYSIPKSKETELREFPISDFYVSPELNFISGVTDYNIGLIDGEQVIIKSAYLIGSETNTINVENVRRQGRLGVRITLPVKEVTKTLRFPIYSDEESNDYIIKFNKRVYSDDEDYGIVDGDYVLSEVTQKYVEYKGDISYYFSGENDIKGYLVNHRFYEATDEDETIDIETYLYIEDGKLIVGETEYYVDFSYQNEIPEIKRYVTDINEIIDLIEEYDEYLSDEKKEKWMKQVLPVEPNFCLGTIDGCKCYALADSNGNLLLKDYLHKDWKRVTKFSIIKNENPQLVADDVLYGGYKNYIEYGGENIYLSETYDNEGNYLGYGITIGDTFYAPTTNYGNQTLYENHHDLSYENDLLYILDTDEYVNIKSSIASFEDGGKFIIFIGNELDNDIQVGNFILAESNCEIYIQRPLTQDDNGLFYFVYNGRRYDVENHLFDTVRVSGEDYRLTYTDLEAGYATTIINGEEIPFIVKSSYENGELIMKAHINYNIFYQDKSVTDYVSIKYGINEEAYEVTNCSGLTIDDKVYRVMEEDMIDAGGNPYVYRFIEMYQTYNATFEVTDINGSSTYICYPVVYDSELDEIEMDRIQRDICSVVVDNKDLFNFRLRKDTFGDKTITAINGLYESLSSTTPYVASNSYLLENSIHIYRVYNYISLNFPLTNGAMNNLMREDIIKNSFVDYVKENSVNGIVDMEKDVYYPAYREGNAFKPIQRIVFNLHFRNRNLDNWMVIEDDRESVTDISPNYNKSNWFVTDYDFYHSIDARYLQFQSDLLGFLNFSTSEVKNQANKIGKSFLRLSFYSTNNPQTQVLLGTSTIFLDEQRAFRKYMTIKANQDLLFTNVVTKLPATDVSTFTEVNGNRTLDDELRLSSSLIVNDKDNTTISSEGYYFYMFKEYAKKMREATIYLRIDFNHAGIGKTIPFMVPRILSTNGNVDEEELMLLNRQKDSMALKEGFNMKDIYKQVYLPIHIKYDDKENKYVYYLCEGSRIQNKSLYGEYIGFVSDDVMVFNLFEVKFANESLIRDESNQ